MCELWISTFHQPRVAFWKQSLTSRLVHTLENVNSSFTPTRSESIPPFQETVVDPFSHQCVTWHQKNLHERRLERPNVSPKKKNMSEHNSQKKGKLDIHGYPWFKEKNVRWHPWFKEKSRDSIPIEVFEKLKNSTASKVVTCNEGGADMLLWRCLVLCLEVRAPSTA